MVTAFTHDFFGTTTSKINIFTYASAIMGTFSATAGILVLTMRKRAVVVAVLLLGPTSPGASVSP